MAYRSRFVASAMAASVLLGITPCMASSLTTLYSFADGNDGGFPEDGVVWGLHHDLYGTANNGGNTEDQDGTVFRLSPPAKGGAKWTETTLYSFSGGADGGQPSAGLAVDSQHRLYGTDQNIQGIPSGIAFRIDPPARKDGPWRMETLHSFNGFDGQSTAGSMTFGRGKQKGVLYGASDGGSYGEGDIFSLSPPSNEESAWQTKVLYSFTGNSDGGFPFCQLVWGPDNALYGTTSTGGSSGNGTVFRLLAPNTASPEWTFELLYSFTGGADGGQSYAGLVIDPQGSLYGVTFLGGANNVGVVFQITKTGPHRWTETVLHNFSGGADSNPDSAMLRDQNGNLFGTATGVSKSYETGELFELTPPLRAGGTWTFNALHVFSGRDGRDPSGNLLLGRNHEIIGTTYYGGKTDKGTVYQYAPDQW